MLQQTNVPATSPSQSAAYKTALIADRPLLWLTENKVLVWPGPREQGGQRGEVHRSCINCIVMAKGSRKWCYIKKRCLCRYKQEVTKKRAAMERLNVPLWSSRAAVSVPDLRQWHMRDIRVAWRERQRSLVLCKNEDTSFSISASLSTDRHANANPHKDIRTQSHTGHTFLN